MLFGLSGGGIVNFCTNKENGCGPAKVEIDFDCKVGKC